LQGVGQIRFLAREEIGTFLSPDRWDVEVAEYHTFEDIKNAERGLHSEWRIIARKRA